MAVKRAEELKPVYLIYGEEDLLLELALQRLRGLVAEVADLDFNFDAFQGESADPGDIIAAADTLPFASERRLVVVHDVDRMSASNQAVLAEHVVHPSPTTCLVMVARKMRKDSKLVRAVASAGEVAEYKPPKYNEYPRWVTQFFDGHGRTIDRDAVEALLRAAGRDLRRLATEAEKIMVYAGDRTHVTTEDVESVISGAAPVSIFEFLDALGARESARALGLLDQLLANGEELMRVHAMAARHVRQLISVSALAGRDLPIRQIQKEAGMADWQVRKALAQSRRFEPDELSTALRRAAEVERRMKSGQGDARLVFERWVTAMCGSER